MVRTPLPTLLLLHGLLTQSRWNTVSPGVQISAEGDGKRNLRHPDPSHPFSVCVLPGVWSICTCGCAHTGLHGGPVLTSGVFLEHTLLYLLMQSVFLNLELASSGLSIEPACPWEPVFISHKLPL